MREVQAHDYPGLGSRWYREAPLDFTEGAEALIQSVFMTVEPLLRAYEVELELSHDEGHLERGLRVQLPPGLDGGIGPWPTDVVEGDRLGPRQIASWADPLYRPVGAILNDLVIRTGCVAACVPEWADGERGIDLLVGGETYHRRTLEIEGQDWIAGPIKRIGAPAPIEVTLTGRRRQWLLDVSLLWSAWELGRDLLDPRVRSCFAALEAAGWQKAVVPAL